MKVMLFIVICFIFSLPAFASATANEFVPCKKMAVSKLAYCLQEEGTECWNKSKSSFEACYQRVIQRHQPNHARIEAEKNAQKVQQ